MKNKDARAAVLYPICQARDYRNLGAGATLEAFRTIYGLILANIGRVTRSFGYKARGRLSELTVHIEF